MQSADRIWSVNVSSSALSLTCTRYTDWNEFMKRMTFLVEQFCARFKIETITRVGLRYINAVKPSTIGCMDEKDVLNEPYQRILSPLLGNVIGTQIVLEYQRTDDIKGRSIIGNIVFSDGEKGIMIDDDLYVESNLPMDDLVESLMSLNRESLSVFKSIVSDGVLGKVV